MEKKLNLIMPMAGGGTRFKDHGFMVPKPLIEIYENPFFYWATESVKKFVDLQSLTFVVLKNHVEEFKIDQAIRKFYPYANVIVIPDVLPGAVLTCLHGLVNIADDQPILFNDCDHLFLCSEFYNFCNQTYSDDIDGGLLVFKANESKYSYALCNEKGYVLKTVEKQPISEDAICGAYYFRNKELFSITANEYIKSCSYTEFYVSGVYNTMIKRDMKVKKYNIDAHVSFGTPEEYEQAINSKVYRQLI